MHPDVQAGFRKGRGTRDQIANICWIIKKAGGSKKTSGSDGKASAYNAGDLGSIPGSGRIISLIYSFNFTNLSSHLYYFPP